MVFFLKVMRSHGTRMGTGKSRNSLFVKERYGEKNSLIVARTCQSVWKAFASF
jgi:hypothetical protein